MLSICVQSFLSVGLYILYRFVESKFIMTNDAFLVVLHEKKFMIDCSGN